MSLAGSMWFILICTVHLLYYYCLLYYYTVEVLKLVIFDVLPGRLVAAAVALAASILIFLHFWFVVVLFFALDRRGLLLLSWNDIHWRCDIIIIVVVVVIIIIVSKLMRIFCSLLLHFVVAVLAMNSLSSSVAISVSIVLIFDAVVSFVCFITFFCCFWIDNRPCNVVVVVVTFIATVTINHPTQFSTLKRFNRITLIT